jgi:hypothetical protein
MQDEMDKALQQRDLAESRLDGFLKKMEASAQSRALVSCKILILLRKTSTTELNRF